MSAVQLDEGIVDHFRATLTTAAAVGMLAVGACRDATTPDHPDCGHPAPLLGSYNPAAPAFIVQYRDGIDPVAQTEVLAAKYHFTPSAVYTFALHGFAAEMSGTAV